MAEWKRSLEFESGTSLPHEKYTSSWIGCMVPGVSDQEDAVVQMSSDACSLQYTCVLVEFKDSKR